MQNLSFILLLSVEPGVVLFVLFAVGMVAYSARKESLALQERNEKMGLKQKAIEQRIAIAKKYLEKNFTYYQRLSDAGKEKFIARLKVVLASKRIIGFEGLRVTREMQILTAAAFVQVTFGMDNFRLDGFRTIGLYPDIYHDRRLRRNLKGGTSTAGVIRMSWKHLKYGYLIPDDNINLALHELAHAIKISVERNNLALDREISSELFEFVEASDPLRSAIMQGKITSLRKYAALNADELFACCVEYFFENPVDFNSKLPTVYNKMCKILGQDASNSSNDYIFKTATKVAPLSRISVVNRKVEDNAYGWTSPLMLLGVFVGPLGLMLMLREVESEFGVLLLFLLTVFIVGFLIFWRKLFVSGYMSSFVFVAFLVLGWWLPASIGGMLVNKWIPIYTIEEVETGVRLSNNVALYRIVVNGSKFESLRSGYEINLKDYTQLKRMENIEECTIVSEGYYGILGLKMFSGVRVECGEKTYGL